MCEFYGPCGISGLFCLKYTKKVFQKQLIPKEKEKTKEKANQKRKTSEMGREILKKEININLAWVGLLKTLKKKQLLTKFDQT